MTGEVNEINGLRLKDPRQYYKDWRIFRRQRIKLLRKSEDQKYVRVINTKMEESINI